MAEEQKNTSALAIKQAARPVAFVLVILTLCFLAIGEACGYNAPTWFITLGGAIASEWLIERVIRKNKGEE